MAITEDRVTIFTKNKGKYSGIALILDLTRSINHTYGSTVAAHPVEGSGTTVADHQYLKNIKIQISGHISNGVKIPVLTSDFDSFGHARNYNAAIEEDLDRIAVGLESDAIVNDNLQAGVPLTEEEARVLTDGSDTGEVYEAGQEISEADLESLKESTASNISNAQISVSDAKQGYVDDQALIAATESKGSDRRVYSNNQLNKQLDALILLENIRDNRLLVDILTPNRLYTDMTINFNLPRNMRQGNALEVNITSEQQRFFEAEVQSLPYSNESDDIVTTENQDEKPKEVAEQGPITKALVKALAKADPQAHEEYTKSKE